jgi:hypothetical protein
MTLPSHRIVRFLRLIASSACRGSDRVPLSIIANLTGVSRLTLYRARDGHVTEETARLLSPLVRAYEAGKLKFRRTSPRSRYPNHWEVVEP